MDIYEKLKHLAKMETEVDIKQFELTVWSLSRTKDPEVLRKLIDLFDDDCPYDEVMYSLVHAIETYPDEIYVKTVLEKLEHGLEQYPTWVNILVAGIFNHKECRKIFSKNLHLTSKKALLKLFDLLEHKSSYH